MISNSIRELYSDKLTASKTKEASDQNIILTLKFLANEGYKVSKGKSTHFSTKCRIPRIWVIKRTNFLVDQKEALARVTVPTTRSHCEDS